MGRTNAAVSASRRPAVILMAVALVLAVMLGHPGSAAAAGVAAMPSAAPACHPYPDVDGFNSACHNIAWLKTMGITKPADGLYHPRSSVTRGAMAAFLFRLVHPGKASPTCTSRPFPDVPVGSTFCGYITWAKNAYLVYGYSNGDYGTSRPVTRGAMAAYLNRMAESSPAPKCTKKPFTDVPIDSTFCPVITWMKATNITYGIGGGKYGTALPVTRQAMASFLHRAVDHGYLGIPAPSLALYATHDEVTSGTSPRFTYTAKNVPSPATVTLQMMDHQDAKPTWKSVQTVPAGSGSLTGPKVSGWMFRSYRLQVVDDGNVLGTSTSVDIGVYGKVPLTTLCTVNSSTVYATCPSPGTVPVGDDEFHYGGEVQAGPFDTNQWTKFMSAYTWSCRSITLRFAVESTFKDPSNLQELHAWTDSGASYSATAYFGQIGTLTVPMNGDGINFEVRSDPYSALDQDIFVGGWASCMSSTGLPVIV